MLYELQDLGKSKYKLDKTNTPLASSSLKRIQLLCSLKLQVALYSTH
jgi:hypothetical protein